MECLQAWKNQQKIGKIEKQIKQLIELLANHFYKEGAYPTFWRDEAFQDLLESLKED